MSNFILVFLVLIFLFGMNIPMEGTLSRYIDVVLSFVLTGLVVLSFFVLSWKEALVALGALILMLPTVGKLGLFVGAKIHYKT